MGEQARTSILSMFIMPLVSNVEGDVGADSEVRTAYIEVVRSEVTAGFTADPVSGYAPLTVSFSNASVGDVTDQLWDFGDGETSPESSPSHLYPKPGNYLVQLTVRSECEEDTIQALIKVLSPEWETYNYPNPFNPVDGKMVSAPDGTVATDGTIIKYTLPDDTDDEVLVSIYSIGGELVKELDFSSSEYRRIGEHYIEWDGRNGHGQMVSGGVYIYYIEAGRHKATRKMAVIK
ncbi:MAG: PKD domain-containing protein [bacterium]|nr:PKD domain-containing protein [bacterium]